MVGFNNCRWETQTKIRHDTSFPFFFLTMEMLKHSLWKPTAAIYNTAITPPRQRWNLIRLERLHKRIFILIVLVKVPQGLSVDRPLLFQASLTYLRFLAFFPTPCLKPSDTVRSPQQWGVCSGTRRKEASEGWAHPVGLHLILKTYGVSELSKRQGKKFPSTSVREITLT